MSKREWIPDLLAEQTLKDFGVSWETADISIADIDREESRLNHARIGGKPIDDELALEYGTAMEQGDFFPRIVVRKKGRKYVVMGGNHRVEAADAVGIGTIGAYVVDCGGEDQAVDLIPRALNRKGSRRTGKDEAYLHAMHAINKYGYTFRDAAKTFGVSEKALGNKIAVKETREQLVKTGLPGQQLSDDALRALATVRDNENVLSAAANVIARGKMTGKDAHDMVKKIKEQRTEASRISVVADYEKRLGIGNGKPESKRVQKRMRLKFLGALTRVEGVVGRAQTLAKLQITEEEEKKHVSERLVELGNKFKRLANSR